MLGWAGLRGISAANTGVQSLSDLRSIVLMISAVAVAGTALFAAAALWRGSERAIARTKTWAVSLFVDLVLQEFTAPSATTPVWFRLLIIAGIGCLLLAVVQHVQHYCLAEGDQNLRGAGANNVGTVNT